MLIYNSEKDKPVSRSELALVETPAALGRFHKPLSYIDYIDRVTNELHSNGIIIANEEFAITKDGGRMFGLMEIVADRNKRGALIVDDDWKLTVGVRGSHDQSIPRGLTLGSQVMVCSNLCFHGSIGTIQTKQTLNLLERLPGMLREAISKIPELAYNQSNTFGTYRNFEIKPRHGDAALVEIFRRGGFSAAQLARAINEWDTPAFSEHNKYGSSAWKLFNAATQALKPTGENVNMEIIRDRSETISNFINEVVGI